jgi:hypothetical protein
MAAGEGPGRLAPTDFSTFVLSLGSNVLVHLGLEAEGVEIEKPPEPNFELAEHTIGLLAMLEEKTRGNLSPDEESLLGGVLYQTRLAFVRARDRAREAGPPASE